MAGNKSPSEETDATEDSVAAEETGGTEVTDTTADAPDTDAGTEGQADETDGADPETAEARASEDDADFPPEDDADTSSEEDTDTRPEEDADAAENADAGETAPETDADTAPVAATPSTMDHPEQGQSGPGFFPLALGGIVAGVAGFAGGYFFDLNTGDQIADLTGSLETQGAEIATLTEETTALAERAGALEDGLAGLAPPEVDLSGIEGSLEGLASRLDGLSSILGDLDTRISAIENRPVFTGEGGADEAAVAAAIAQLRSDIRAEQEANAELAASIGAMADDAAARIAQAEERAAASATAASAQAALSELRIAIASGAPFAAPLAEVAAAQGFDIPDEIAAVAETGVPTLAEIEAGFPAAARAALPVALQANAGDTAGERLGAFLRSQVGGRALNAQEGSDPDAILSRAGAAVSTGDLSTALEELTALPDPARAAMSDWMDQADLRLSALEAIDGFSGAIGN